MKSLVPSNPSNLIDEGDVIKPTGKLFELWASSGMNLKAHR